MNSKIRFKKPFLSVLFGCCSKRCCSKLWGIQVWQILLSVERDQVPQHRLPGHGESQWNLLHVRGVYYSGRNCLWSLRLLLRSLLRLLSLLRRINRSQHLLRPDKLLLHHLRLGPLHLQILQEQRRYLQVEVQGKSKWNFLSNSCFQELISTPWYWLDPRLSPRAIRTASIWVDVTQTPSQVET